MRPKPYADCPEESTLQEVAAEMASPETSTRILQHASQCDHCGPLLSQYLEDFSDELSPEIEALIDQLPFSQPQWQREKAREIARNLHPQPIPWWKRFTDLWSRRWMPAMVGTMAALAGVGIVIEPPIMNLVQIGTGTKLVDKAYAQNRTLESRFPGAPHAAFQKFGTTMGPDDQDLQKRPALSDALNYFTQKLPSDDKKVDPKWFQLQGRLILLKDPKDWSGAEKAFEKAIERGLNTPSLKIDLAIAYYQRGIQTQDFKPAIDKLQEVLTDKDADSEEKKTAQFNLALAYEQQRGAHDSAVAAWTKYLSMDSSGEWAREANAHLQKLNPGSQEHLYPIETRPNA